MTTERHIRHAVAVNRRRAAKHLCMSGLLALTATTLSSCAAIPGMGIPGTSQAADPAPIPVIQPVQTSDAQMTCAELEAESSNMDHVIADATAAAPPPQNSFTNSLEHAAGAAAVPVAIGALSALVPGAAYLGSTASSVEMQQASQAQLQTQTPAQIEAQKQAAASNAQQRKTYLATLMQQKKCDQQEQNS